MVHGVAHGSQGGFVFLCRTIQKPPRRYKNILEGFISASSEKSFPQFPPEDYNYSVGGCRSYSK